MLRQIAKLGEDGAFTPEDIRILVAAFDAAWASVMASGAPFSEERHQATARDVLAKAIIQAVKSGERNEHRLTDAALLQLSRTTLKSPRGGLH